MTAWGTGEVTIVDGVVPHVVNLLGPRPAGYVRQSVVILQAVDELTGRAVRGPVTVTTSVAGLAGGGAENGTAGGIVGLVGVPSRALPGLDAHAHTVDVTVQVAGYTPWTRSVPFPVQPGFPDTFAGVDLGVAMLRRRPVSLEITTLSLDVNNRLQPLSGADVRIAAVWRRVADLGAAGVAAPMVGLPLGVSQYWPAGTALDSVTLVPAIEPARRLLRGAAPQDRAVDVDVLGALVIGDLLGLDLADAGRREYLAVAGFAGPTLPASPAVVEAGGPVRVPHAQASMASRVPPPPAAPPDATLTEPAEAGDTTVFVDTVAPFATVEILRASGGTLADEYLDSHLFRATTDADGFARIPALSRVAAVEITATRGALAATTRFTPDYLSPRNIISLILR